MKVNELVDLYLADVEARGLRPNTVRSYRDRLRRFREQFGERDVASVKGGEVEQYLSAVVSLAGGRKAAPDTTRLSRIVVQQVQQFAKKKKLLKKVWVKKVTKPGGRRRERIPSRREHVLILKNADRAFRTIYKALRASGARPSELTSATIDQYKAEQGVLVQEVHKTADKVGRSRRIGVGRKMRRLLERAIAGRSEGPIFLDGRGRPWTTNRLSQRFRRLVDAAGIDRELKLYCLRHGVGTEVCKRLGIQAAAHALGHTSINTTQRYVHLDDEALREAQDAI